MNENKQDRVQLIDLKKYYFPKGFKIATKIRIWLDGDDKVKAAENKETFPAKDAKHEFALEFDMSEVNLDEFVRKVLVTSSSPRVKAQNRFRPIWRKKYESEEAFEEWIALPGNDKIIVSVAETLELRQKLTDGEKAIRQLNKVTSKEDLEKILADAQAKLAAMA